MKTRIRFVLIAVAAMGLSACQTASEDKDQVGDEARKTTQTDAKTASLDFEDYLYPFGIDLSGMDAKEVSETMGDCKTDRSSYGDVGKGRSLLVLKNDCFDYGNSLDYLLVKDDEILRYHSRSKEALSDAEKPSYVFEEHVYIPKSDSTYKHYLRRDTLPATEPDLKAFQGVGLEFDAKKPVWTAADMRVIYKTRVEK